MKNLKHLSILVPQGDLNLSSIVGSLKVFTIMNDYRVSQGGERVFQIELIGCGKTSESFGGLFTIHPQKTFEQVGHTDLIIVPALKGDIQSAIKQNQKMTDWIFNQYRQGAEVACICSGAAMLATTGLLDGKKCSTHWRLADGFKTMFPNIDWVGDRIITGHHGIYTNGGGYSFLNLLVHLVEKYFGRSDAIYCSKFFQIEIDRNCQSPFVIFSGQKNHSDSSVLEAQLYIETHIDTKIPVEELATKFASGKRNFDRRFRKATSNSPAEYIQRVKIEAAKKSLESGRKTVSDVMYEVGYSDSKSFRNVFKKLTGLSPLDYRNRYNAETAG